MSTSPSALESLLGADGARELLASHWPHRPYVHRPTAGVAGLPAPLRDPIMLDPSNLTRVYRGSIEVTSGRGGQQRVTGPDPSVYFDVLGLAVRFSDLEPYLPAAVPWLRALERDLGVPEGAASLHAFINAENVGLATHCDPGEHIAIQLAGTKQFRFLANPRTRFASISHSPTLDPARTAIAQSPDGLPTWTPLPPEAETVVLEPGSVLFLPRGTYHETIGGAGGRSVTLVIQVGVPSARQLVLGYLADYLGQSEAWREPLVGAWPEAAAGRDATAARLEHLLAELGRELGGLSTEAILRHAERGAAAQQFTWGAQLQRNPFIRVELADDQDQVVVTVATAAASATAAAMAPARLSLTAEIRPVLDWILAREGRFDFATVVRTFDDWDEASLAAVLRFLVANRAVTVLPFEPYAQAKPVVSLAS